MKRLCITRICWNIAVILLECCYQDYWNITTRILPECSNITRILQQYSSPGYTVSSTDEAIGSIGTSCSMCSLCRFLSMVLKFVPRRNGYIRSVVLLEGDSIVLLPECLESSGVQFLISIGFLVSFDLPQKPFLPVYPIFLTFQNSTGTTMRTVSLALIANTILQTNNQRFISQMI